MSGFPPCRRPFFDVRAFGATGDGVSNDTAAIQSAINAAQETIGRVFLPTGRYLINSPLVLQNPDSTSGLPSPVPSLVGAVPPGRIGDAADSSGVTLVCGSAFPTGEYAIQVLGASSSVAPTGCELANFELDCKGLGAGILLHQPREGRFHDFTIIDTATPLSSSSQPFGVYGDAALNIAQSNGTASAYNVFSGITVSYAANDSFFTNSLGKDTFIGLYSLNPERAAYNISTPDSTWIACNYSGGQTGWLLGVSTITVFGSSIAVGTITGNAVLAYAVVNVANETQGIVFDGCTLISNGAVPLVSIQPNGSDSLIALFKNCRLDAYGNAGTPQITNWVEIAAGIPGSVRFDQCVFTGTPTSTPFVDNSGILQVSRCEGINPVGSAVPGTAFALPASGTAWTNQTGVDGTLYVTEAGTVTDVVLQGVTVASSLTVGQSFFVPAGGTITFTYSVAPTLEFVGN